MREKEKTLWRNLKFRSTIEILLLCLNEFCRTSLRENYIQHPPLAFVIKKRTCFKSEVSNSFRSLIIFRDLLVAAAQYIGKGEFIRSFSIKVIN